MTFGAKRGRWHVGGSNVRSFYVYIMASKSKVLYIGVTNNLMRRVLEHRHGADGGFTARYRIDMLVYFEETSEVLAAIAREKQLKGWTRARKLELVEHANPQWQDLAEHWIEGD